MSPQCKRVADYLLLNRYITSLDAATKMQPPCMRLSERIRELESMGWQFIKTTPEPAKHYVEYYLTHRPSEPVKKTYQFALPF